MTMRHKLSLAAAFAIALSLPLGMWAQNRHPRYLHARSDLRRAVLLMRLPEEPNVMRDMDAASGLVERAIHELDLAAMFDRKDIDDHPPIDTRMGRGGRFREVLRLLDSARNDISHEEDNPRAAEWRNRAFAYLDQAAGYVRKGGYDKLRDEAAPPPPPPPPPPQAHPALPERDRRSALRPRPAVPSRLARHHARSARSGRGNRSRYRRSETRSHR